MPKSVTISAAPVASAAITDTVNYARNPSAEVNGQDDWYSHVKALLHMDGVDGSIVFTDETGHVWTRAGDAQIDTAQSVFGGASGLFDGAGDYISSPASADWAFGTGDFTVDAWVRMPAAGVGDRFIYSGATNGDFFFGFTGASIGIGRTGVAWDYTAAHGIANNTWAHVAVTRSGVSVRLFVNGIQVGAGAALATDYHIDTTAYIGSQGAAFYYSGWLDEVRISKGIAWWTANFAVPAVVYKALRDTTQAYIGVASFNLASGGPVPTDLHGMAGVSVPDGAMVFGHCRIRAAADPTGNLATLVLYDQTTPAVRGTIGATAAAVGAWEYVSVAWTNTTGAPKTVSLYCYNNFNDTLTVVWFDACQLELGPGTPYCDGSLGTHYSWGGAAHNSVSRHITPAGVLRGYARNLRPSAGPSNALAEAGTFSNYSHKIRGLGGFWQCSFIWHDEMPILMEMMAEGWVRDILVMGERGMEVWEGFVAAMELSLSGGMPALKVTGYGYFRTLFWRAYNQTASGHVDAYISDEIGTIVTAVGQFIAGQSRIANWSLVDRYHDADRFAGDILFDMCAAGDQQNRRRLIGCYEARQLRYEEIARYWVV